MAIFPLTIWIIYLKLQRSLHSFEMINSFVSVCKEAYRKLFSIEIFKEGIQIGSMHSVRLTQDQGNEFLEMRNLSGNDTDVFYHRELQRGCNERASFSGGIGLKRDSSSCLL